MKKLITLFFIFLLLDVIANANGLGEIGGKIIDAKNKKPVDYANILAKKDGKIVAKVLSDDDGYFLIKNLVPGVYSLQVSCVGYEKQEINKIDVVSDTKVINNNILMKSNGTEVVEIGCRLIRCYVSNTVINKVDSAKEAEAWYRAQREYHVEVDYLFGCKIEHKSRLIESKLKQTGVTLINQITVFPNPTSDVLNIETMFDGNKKLRIVSMAGVVKHSSTIIHHATINVGDWQNGIYIVEVVDELNNERTIERLIIQH